MGGGVTGALGLPLSGTDVDDGVEDTEDLGAECSSSMTERRFPLRMRRSASLPHRSVVVRKLTKEDKSVAWCFYAAVLLGMYVVEECIEI